MRSLNLTLFLLGHSLIGGFAADAGSALSGTKLPALQARQGPKDLNDALLESDISKAPIPLPQDPDKWLAEHPEAAKDPAVALANEVDNPFNGRQPPSGSTEKDQQSTNNSNVAPSNDKESHSPPDMQQPTTEQTPEASSTGDSATTQPPASASTPSGLLPWLDGEGCKDVSERCLGTDDWCTNHYRSALNDNVSQCFERRGFFLQAFEDAIAKALESEAEEAVFNATSGVSLDTGIRELAKQDGTQASAKNAAESAARRFLQLVDQKLEASVNQGVDKALARFSSQ
ncbi:hypothetical protein EYZ11_011109 [Aspergillus tanneri]|uniref:Extracellular membrane protein CFEM domain-containing protein n=1 Tax=Aspergillus tanneri TaxID=1220188 RepID=A0A4S3J3M1_9EURO|nr:uncharacterized protein ATNIH1004_006554 [Aspergillus tanneri]KAA8647852.1 hypothetical protein ATNIH1004_006554 [Aspergillus tanneri]THC89446.1 hypothetical protein EYZ11_011109 [Aspergillus tanneri]